MSEFGYIMPLITVAPPPGYTLAQYLPLSGLRSLLNVNDATLFVRRALIANGEVRLQDESRLVLEQGEWTNADAGAFFVDTPDIQGWMGGDVVPYLETSITAERGVTFSSRTTPAHYTVYSGERRKTFLSDNRIKFSDNVVISQISEHGVWADGYPICEVDPAADLDISLVLLNPFQRPAVATLEFEGCDVRPRFRLNSCAGQRISFAQCLGEKNLPWSGQVYITGRNRLIPFVCHHSYRDPSAITTLEHTDAYRGENQKRPFSRALHYRRTWPAGDFSPKYT